MTKRIRRMKSEFTRMLPALMTAKSLGTRTTSRMRKAQPA